MTGRKSLLIALGFIVLGAAYLWQATGLPAARADDVLGPATMPLTLGVGLVGLATLLGVTTLYRRRGDAELAPVCRDQMAVLLGIVIYVAALPFAGFMTATALFLFLGALWGGQRPISAGLFATGMVALLYVVFEVVFRVALPRSLG
jgi:putative tricarboxylic transport membrane protein